MILESLHTSYPPAKLKCISPKRWMELAPEASIGQIFLSEVTRPSIGRHSKISSMKAPSVAADRSGSGNWPS